MRGGLKTSSPQQKTWAGAPRADRTDATDEDGIHRWIDRDDAEFGAIDILATRVGWMECGFSFSKDQTPDPCLRMMAQQFWAEIHLAHAILPYMISRQSGPILTVASGPGAPIGAVDTLCLASVVTTDNDRTGSPR